MIDNNDFKLWDEFLAIWPVEKIKIMTLAQYTGVDDKTTFTYWLEHILRPYGSILGGSAEKFGIFKKKNKEANPKSHLMSDDNYTWNAKYGDSPQQAFEKVRSLIVQVIQYIQSGVLAAIKNIDLAFTLKWKIAFHYQNREKPLLVGVFREEALQCYFQEQTSITQVVNKIKEPLTQYNLLKVSFEISAKWKQSQKIKIWKISHGLDAISQDKLELLDSNQYIKIHQDTAKSQAKHFKAKIQIGDIVYLTRSNGIYALGRIISNCEQTSGSPWLLRKYELIEKLPKAVVYNGLSKGWTPNYNSTLFQVPTKDLSLFESTILTPIFDYTIDELIGLSEVEPYHFSRDNKGVKEMNNNQPLNRILYGPPGTGKTYDTINIALNIIGIDTQGKERNEIKQLFDEKIASGQIVFTTFHQSTCYEDFIEGIKPILDDSCEESQIGYQIEEGVFKQLANKAKVGNLNKTISIDEAIGKFKEICVEQKVTLHTSTSKLFDVKYHGNTTFRCYPQESAYEDLGNGYPASISRIIEYIISGESKTAYNPSYVKAIGEYLKSHYKLDVTKQSHDKKQNFVLIIDEINRGNVSQIFGELITLIEEDKRLGNKEALTVTLPYSKAQFSVPNNLYIIGTMNTADRSVEALDTALRRRFSFIEMLPKPECLVGEPNRPLAIEGIILKDLLITINQRIELLLDRDHLIGHSYFMNIKNLNDLGNVLNNKIVPLLQEYFFNDYSKIGLVLGKGFVEQTHADFANTIQFADFNDSLDVVSQYQEKNTYQLKSINTANIIDALNLMKIKYTDK